jgi:hypothetical protein
MVGGALGGAIGAAAGVVGGLLGSLGSGSQTLAKLEIVLQNVSPPKKIIVPFNPASYTIHKTVNWAPPNTLDGQGETTERGINAPRLEPRGGDSRTITLDLFFDITENPDVDDVRKQTNEIAKLTYIDRDTGVQPICALYWGDAIGEQGFPFVGVVTSLDQSFLLFRSNGKPVRAKLTVSFREYIDPERDQRKTDPELTTHLVKRGDTLSSIANEFYGNPRLWRVIAETNGLDNPLAVQPGQALSIPELS